MTLQQMEYIVALDKYPHFVLAEACGVTQPTLNAVVGTLKSILPPRMLEEGIKRKTIRLR